MTDESKPAALLTDKRIDEIYREVWSAVPIANRLPRFARKIEAEVLRASSGSLREADEMLRLLRHYTLSHLLCYPTCGAPTEDEIDAVLVPLRAALSPSGPMISLNAVAAEPSEREHELEAAIESAMEFIEHFAGLNDGRPNSAMTLMESLRAVLANTQGTEP